ncbi:MAG: hypothetical protein CVV27_05255 [Candidatus Melainabacteria bacterium HGW-Melainabacteria-1]|nr:MAG: hypothetical protein CVV27_05255 [Candidatus Melainabacteria bacterium HGW-Melainabacteria-1]
MPSYTRASQICVLSLVLSLSACEGGFQLPGLSPASSDSGTANAPLLPQSQPSATDTPKSDPAAGARLRLFVELQDFNGAIRILSGEQIAEVSVDGKVLDKSEYAVADGAVIIENSHMNSGRLQIRIQGAAEPVEFSTDPQRVSKEVRLRTKILLAADGEVESYESGQDGGSAVDTGRPFLRGSKDLLQVIEPTSGRIKVYLTGAKGVKLSGFDQGAPVYASDSPVLTLRGQSLLKGGIATRTKQPSLTLVTTLNPIAFQPLLISQASPTPAPSPSPSQELACDRFAPDPDGRIIFRQTILLMPSPAGRVPIPLFGIQLNQFNLDVGSAYRPFEWTRHEYEFRADGSIRLTGAWYGQTVGNEIVALPAGTIIYPTPCDLEGFWAEATPLPTPPPLPTKPPPVSTPPLPNFP